MKIIIDRSKWRTGSYEKNRTGGKGPTRLLNGDGAMCCLGFLSNQLGVPKESLLDVSTPSGINKPHIEKISVLLLTSNQNSNSIFTNTAMKINDNYETTPEHKEIEVTKLFKEHGFEVEFINEFSRIGDEVQDTV